jgi:hypothetical protein
MDELVATLVRRREMQVETLRCEQLLTLEEREGVSSNRAESSVREREREREREIESV